MGSVSFRGGFLSGWRVRDPPAGFELEPDQASQRHGPERPGRRGRPTEVGWQRAGPAGDEVLGDPGGFDLVPIAGIGDVEAAVVGGCPGRAVARLQGMGQFMGQQALPGCRAGRVASVTENNVRTHGCRPLQTPPLPNHRPPARRGCGRAIGPTERNPPSWTGWSNRAVGRDRSAPHRPMGPRPSSPRCP